MDNVYKIILFVICVNYVIATTEMRINYPKSLVGERNQQTFHIINHPTY